MRVLIISKETWQDGTNGGNVLSNIFENIDAEFAQIYCSPGEPSNKLCKRYYQMTDYMIIRNLLKKKQVGKFIHYDTFPNEADRVGENENKFLITYFRRLRLESFLVARELAWKFSQWKNQALEKFILDFKPDIIFAPCYDNHFMLSLDRYVSKLTNKPMISYISDDHYSFAQFRISPVFWFNRIWLRKNLRKTFPLYDLTYTMTEEQKVKYVNVFGVKMKILKKSGEFSEKFAHKPLEKPIRLIYAGGIYCGRWKTLEVIAKALTNINRDETKMILDIYTGNQLTNKQQKKLNDGKNTIVHGLISQDQLRQEYQKSDIALHVESFKLKYKLLTKLSFSTKIVDCLESTCAVMAICWEQHSGYIYLKNEDAALIISSTKDILKELNKILNNPEIINTYAQKAFICGHKNHQKKEMTKLLTEDFQTTIKNYKINFQ